MIESLNHLKKRITLLLVIVFFSTLVHADDVALKTINLEKDWGIQPVFFRVTAQGYMMEFRYKILDPEKAKILSVNKDLPTLLSGKSQARFKVPYGATVGYLKSNRKFLKKGKNYIIMFSNDNQHMLPGDKVRIQIGNEVSPFITIDK
jgi:hypothetical protein